MLTFGEKNALDAYRDFCKAQADLIDQQTRLIAVLSNPQVSFKARPAPMTEFEEDQDYLRRRNQLDMSDVEDLLREADFQNASINQI